MLPETQRACKSAGGAVFFCGEFNVAKMMMSEDDVSPNFPNNHYLFFPLKNPTITDPSR